MSSIPDTSLLIDGGDNSSGYGGTLGDGLCGNREESLTSRLNSPIAIFLAKPRKTIHASFASRTASFFTLIFYASAPGAGTTASTPPVTSVLSALSTNQS